jgi:starch phosphorylase
VRYVRRRFERQLRERGAPNDQIQQARHVLDPNALTLGFARRFAEYKRPTLLLRDPQRLARLLNNSARPVQLIMAGKAHPNDDGGKEMVRMVAQYSHRADVCNRIVFMEDYDIALAQHFATGVDVWLNNPRRPNEACGTSGMKMLVNGGLHCSILDGWWDEGYSPEVGFKIGNETEHDGRLDHEDAESLYEVLETQIATEFYDRGSDDIPHAWVQRVRNSMSRLTAQFSSNRMVKQYTENAYLSAAESFVRRTADNAGLAQDITRWNSTVNEGWDGVRFAKIHWNLLEDQWHFAVQVYFGELSPEFAKVQLYVEPSVVMRPTRFRWTAKVQFTAR